MKISTDILKYTKILLKSEIGCWVCIFCALNHQHMARFDDAGAWSREINLNFSPIFRCWKYREQSCSLSWHCTWLVPPDHNVVSLHLSREGALSYYLILAQFTSRLLRLLVCGLDPVLMGKTDISTPYNIDAQCFRLSVLCTDKLVPEIFSCLFVVPRTKWTPLVLTSSYSFPSCHHRKARGTKHGFPLRQPYVGLSFGA